MIDRGPLLFAGLLSPRRWRSRFRALGLWARHRWQPEAVDQSTAAVRLEQVRERTRIEPSSVTSGVITALLVAIQMRGQVDTRNIVLWLLGVASFGAFRAFRWFSARKTKIAPASHRAAFVDATLSAAALATLWLVPGILWFRTIDGPSRFILSTIVVGLMAGGALTMAAIPPAAAAFVIILTAALVHMAVLHDSVVLTVLSVILALVLLQSVFSQARLFASHVRGRLELEEQGQMIKLLREFQASGSDWMWELDANLRISYLSRGMAQSLGKPVHALLGKRIVRIVDPDGEHVRMSEGARTLFGHLERNEAFHEIAFPTHDGERWYCLSGRPIRDGLGAVTGWRGVASDITDLRFGNGTEGVKIARRDPLTGLANRLLVREMIEESRLRQRAGTGSCVLLLLDLDRFKLVNDTLGHAVGDRLLFEVARRLEDECGPDGTVGRVGGDEFAIVWLGSADALTLMDLAERIVEKIDRAFTIGPTPIHVGVSIGIARAPSDGETQNELMRSADLALYRAKERRNGTHVFYEPWMLAKAQAERLLENDVREAVCRGDLRLHYQPIVDTVTRRTVAHEALLRWWHPQRGAIGPDVFVPIIEDVGLINQIGDWVIREACLQATRWTGGERVSVNISVAQLSGPGLRQTVEQALSASGLPAERLELEVTENIFLGDDAATLAALSSIQALGVRLVLDDFGKGYSSFGYLARARFSKIKIDQLFVRGAAAGQGDCLAIVQSILALARGLKVETTAEGIETLHQADMMTTLGCTQMQGYLFGRAVRAEDIRSMDPVPTMMPPPFRLRA